MNEALRGLGAAALFATLMGGFGCGGAGPRGADEPVHVATTVTLIQPSRERVRVSPDEARTRGSIAALERVLGHPVSIEIDAALTPASQEAVDGQTAESLNALARSFARFADGDPVVTRFLSEHVHTVRAVYKATEVHADADFVPAERALVFTMRSAGRTWLSDGLTLELALQRALSAELAARFAGTRARDVRDADLDAYLRLLARPPRAGGGSRRDADAERASRLLGFLDAMDRVRGTAHAAVVDKELAGGIDWALDRSFAAAVTNAPPGSPLREVARRMPPWWAARVVNGPADPAFARIADAVVKNPERAAALGVDVGAVALALVRANATLGDRDGGPVSPCTYRRRDDGTFSLTRSSGTCLAFRVLASDEAGAAALAAWLAGGVPPETLAAAVLEQREERSRFFQALEKHVDAYRAALRLLLTERSHRHAAFEEAKRALVRLPAARATHLWAIAEGQSSDGPYYADQRWSKFTADYGITLDAALFARFLDEDRRAVELAPTMWSALGSVATPFEIVAPRVDRALATPWPAAARTVSALAVRGCERGDREGLRVLRATLDKRARAGDTNAAGLALAIKDCASAKDAATR